MLEQQAVAGPGLGSSVEAIPNQGLVVRGTATGIGGAEPDPIASLTVKVKGGQPMAAPLEHGSAPLTAILMIRPNVPRDNIPHTLSLTPSFT
jgi:hypothetical protein